jgi:hypothetical protein
MNIGPPSLPGDESLSRNNQADVHFPGVTVPEQQPEPPPDVRSAALAVPAVQAIAPTLDNPVRDANSITSIARTYSRPRLVVEVPARILKLVPPRSDPAVKSLFRHPPVIAGQSIDDYYDLAAVVLSEYCPRGYGEVALVKRIVDEEWKLMTFGEVQKWLLNAEIAEGLLSQLTDLDVGAGDQKAEKSSEAQSRVQQWRRIVFAAVSGNHAMLELVEKQVAYVAFDAFAARHMLEDIRSHILADSVMGAALKRKLNAMRDLEKLRAAEINRRLTREVTAEDIMAMRDRMTFGESALLTALDELAGRRESKKPDADQSKAGGTSIAISDKANETKPEESASDLPSENPGEPQKRVA